MSSPTDPKRSTSHKQRADSLKTVEIAHRTLDISFSTLDVFFEWMAERDRIRKKRFAGEPFPWSQDPVFNHHKFCHVFRIFDRGTQFLLKNVINKGSQEHREVCFRVILFRLFNRISTWNALQEELGPLAWSTFDQKKYKRVLVHITQKSPIYTSAYQIPAPDLVPGPGFQNHLLVLQMMMEHDLPQKLLSCDRMQDAHELIKLYPGMGQFLSYQMVLDLNMTPEINFPENEWAVCGPGSLNCLKKIFGRKICGIETNAIGYLHRTQMQHYARLNITDPPSISAGRPGVSFVDIEHSLCECWKYLSRKNQEGSWEASGEPETNDLPVKWTQEPSSAPGDNSLFIVPPPPTVLPDPDPDGGEDGDTYEVSCIIAERPMPSQGLQYRIRWTGYGPDWDTWIPDVHLRDAPEILEVWRARRLAEDQVNRRVAEIRSSNHPRTKPANPFERPNRRTTVAD